MHHIRIVIGVVAIGLLSASHDSLRAQVPSDSTVPVSPTIRALARSVGASITTIDSLEITDAHATTLSELLEARLPGVSVLRNGGAAADGSRVRMRGTTSFMTNTSPSVIVDGVRVDARQDVVARGAPPFGDQNHLSRLDDISPEEVARIDVLRGAATASLFGPGAGAGVIVVTTKRGAPGPLQLHVFSDAGTSTTAVRFPANYRMLGISTATGQPASSCSNVDVALGACRPTSLQIWNPLEQASILRTGHVVDGGASIAGGTRNSSLAASFGAHRDEGVAPNDKSRRLSARGSVSQRLFDRLDLAAHVGYVDRRDHLPEGVLGAGLFGSAINDSAHGYGPTDSSRNAHAEHFTSGASLRWRILPWLSASATEGRDHARQFAEGVGQNDVFYQNAARSHTLDDSRTSTFDVTLAARYGASARASGRTAVGHEEFRVSGLVDDADTLVGYPGLPGARRRVGSARSRALWLRQNVVWLDQVFLNAALRRNATDLFLSGQPPAWYPSADLSWLVPKTIVGSSLRLRTAYGETAAGSATGSPVFFPTATPSIPPKPERVTEYEFGADAAWGDRASLHLTHFNSVGSHLFMPLLGTGPAADASLSGGRMANAGIEIAARARLLNHPSARWDASFSLATLTNRIVSVGGPGSINYNLTLLEVGFPYSGYWGSRCTFADIDHDGLITRNEIQCTNTPLYIGTSIPTVESSLRSSLDLRSGLSLSTAVDYRGGQRSANQNERVRCALRICRGAQDPSASLSDQARAVDGRFSGYVEDAAFVKLRELRITWALPVPWAHGLGTRDAAVSISGLDLATWTRFRGLDPEVTNSGADDADRRNYAQLPLPRRFILRIDVNR